MKKITQMVIALLSIGAIQTSYSQKLVKHSFSKEFESVRKHEDLGFFQVDTNLFAEAYYRHEEEMVFQIFDKKFSKLKKEETVPLKMEESYMNEGLFNLNNDFFWVYSTWNRSEEKERLWALPFDKKAFKLGKTPIKLSESDKLASSFGYGKYKFYYSNDRSMMMMSCRLKPKERRDKYNKDVIGLSLYNNQMKKLYSHEIEMPYTEAEMDFFDKEIDTKGNIYLLTRVALNNSIDGEKKENKGLFRFELMRVNQKTNTVESFKINLDGKYVNDAILSEDRKGNLVITGYYSERKSGSANGAYIVRYDFNDNTAGKKPAITYCEFPKEVLQAYESERTKRKMEKRDKEDELEATNLTFRRVVFEEDGGLTIIGEEYYVVSHTHTSSNGSTYTSYTYYYDNIIVLKANKEGKTEWCKKIPKYQKGKNNDDLGFYHKGINGNQYFFFLDNKKNINLSPDEQPALHSAGQGGFLMCVKLDANGNIVKQAVLDTREEDVKLRPRSFEYIGGSLIVDRLKESRKTSKVFKLTIL